MRESPRATERSQFGLRDVRLRRGLGHLYQKGELLHEAMHGRDFWILFFFLSVPGKISRRQGFRTIVFPEGFE